MSDEPTFDPRRKAAIRGLVVSNAAAHPGRAGGRKRAAVIAALVALAIGISGGTVAYAPGTGILDRSPAAAPTATPTPPTMVTPTPTAAPTQTTTPTAPAEDPADASTWTIGFDGVGPIGLGSEIDAAPAAAPGFTEVTDPICLPRQRDLQQPDRLGLSVFSTQETPDRIGTIVLAINIERDGDHPVRTPTTDRGIGLGATADELLAAYPDIQPTGDDTGISRFYGLTDGSGTWLVFDVLHDRVQRIQVGPLARIPSEFCPA